VFVCFGAPGGRALPLGDGLKNKVMRRPRRSARLAYADISARKSMSWSA